MMKKEFIVLRFAFIISCIMFVLPSLNAQLFYRDNTLFLGEKPEGEAKMGGNPHILLGTGWGIETYQEGLNFWRPYPSSYWGNYKLFIDQSGKIGINRKPTNYALEVNGQVWTSNGLLITSDISTKSNIKSLGDVYPSLLGKVSRLTAKTYQKEIPSGLSEKDKKEMLASGKITNEDLSKAAFTNHKMTTTTEFGFIAQEVKEIFPELVERNEEGVYAVNYIGLIPVLLESIKELQMKIDKLEAYVKPASITPRSGTITNEYVGIDQECKLYNEAGASVSYRLPMDFTTANLQIVDITGRLVKKFNLTAGSNSMTIDSSEIGFGTFVYILVVDNQKRDTLKKYISR